MVKELNDVFEIVLPQAGLVVTASGIILSLARDVFKLQDRNVGYPEGETTRAQLLYENPPADWLRNWLAYFGSAILVFYLLVAVLLVLIQTGIVKTINPVLFNVYVQGFHFVILIILLVVLVKSIKARELHALSILPAPWTGPSPRGGSQGSQSE